MEQFNQITKEEFLNNFPVTSTYGVPGGWPRVTVAACKISVIDYNGIGLIFHQVFRNHDGKHAEELLIAYLKETIASTYTQIGIEVYINYSPCYLCAAITLDYIKESLKKEIKMAIAFANFYKTHTYPGNSQMDANIEGLKKLYRQPGVKLQLLGGHVAWGTFFNITEFFSLTEEDKKECLLRAESEERQAREAADLKFWNEMFAVDQLTKLISRTSMHG